MVVFYFRLGYNTHPPRESHNIKKPYKVSSYKSSFQRRLRLQNKFVLKNPHCITQDEHYKKKGWGWRGGGRGGGLSSRRNDRHEEITLSHEEITLSHEEITLSHEEITLSHEGIDP